MSEFRIENFGYLKQVSEVLLYESKHVKVKVESGLELDFSISMKNYSVVLTLRVGHNGYSKAWHEQSFGKNEDSDLREWWQRFCEYAWDRWQDQSEKAIKRVCDQVSDLFVK